MKLNYFSEQTLPKQMGGGRKARISFGKSGVIAFNGPASELVGLKAGDKVTLAQDDDEPRNWYIFKDPQHGFELRAGYKDKGFVFNHKEMVEAFITAFGFDGEKSWAFQLAGESTSMAGSKTKYWGILVPG